MQKTIVLTKSVEQLYKRWQGEANEKTGYAIAYDTPDNLTCLVSFATDEGSPEEVEGDPTALVNLVYGFLRKHPDAKVLPVHSHPIEDLSFRDEKTLRTWARFNLEYALVVTPTTINGYHTDYSGNIHHLPVAVIEDSRFSEEYQRKAIEYAKDLTSLKEKSKELYND